MPFSNFSSTNGSRRPLYGSGENDIADVAPERRCGGGGRRATWVRGNDLDVLLLIRAF